MTNARIPATLTVLCDGGEFAVSRREGGVLGPVWVIQMQGEYIGSFEARDGETEDTVRSSACLVIRNGSTSFFEAHKRK